MKYKLRGDYRFFYGKDVPLANKLDKDGKVIEQVIIDDKTYKVEGQLHKLEVVKEPEVVKGKPNDSGQSKQGDTPPKPAVSNDSAKSQSNQGK